MKVIFLLGGYGQQMRPHTWSRPGPLLNVAGNTVLGHMLDLMKAVTTDEVVFVVGYRGDEIRSWIKAHYPHLNAHFVIQEADRGVAHAVWLCREYLENNPAGLLLSSGTGLIDADFKGLAALAAEKDAAAILYVQAEEDPHEFPVAVLDEEGTITRLVEHSPDPNHRQVVVGLTYFHHGQQLFQVVDQLMAQQPHSAEGKNLVDVVSMMLAQNQRLLSRPVHQWSDTGRPQTMLATNDRMLAIGYHSADAIERSYAEEFLVIPPVYLHPEAIVHNAVIGPYATIGAGARVNDAIVRHCIIDAGAEIQQCILEKALVGENARVTGRAGSLFVGDDATVQL